MDLVRAIQHIYPDAEPNKDFFLADLGEGVFIEKWDYKNSQPSKSALEGAWLEIWDEPIKQPKSFENRVEDTEENLILIMKETAVLLGAFAPLNKEG